MKSLCKQAAAALHAAAKVDCPEKIKGGITAAREKVIAPVSVKSLTRSCQDYVKLMLNWRDKYDNYAWEKGTQKPMTDEEKADIEGLAVKILGLKPKDIKKDWGTAYPPGCFAQTVIHVNHSLRHRFSTDGKPVGLKIFNLKRGGNEWRSRLTAFYSTHRSKLPGLPSQHFQEVIAHGTETDLHGRERGYLIQEWVEGENLEALVKRGLAREKILTILDDLFLGMIIPMWAKGTKWWDARRSNYILTPKDRLVMIDPDTLADYGAEIATKPAKFTKRNTCNPDTAMGRYKALIVDMAAHCPDVVDSRGVKSEVKKLCSRLLDEPFRCRYPLPENWAEQATVAYQSLRFDLNKILLARTRLEPARIKFKRTRNVGRKGMPSRR